MNMKKRFDLRLWVVKFCIKVVYPKFNFHLFCVYLAIKYRLYLTRKARKSKIMDVYKTKTVAPSIQKLHCKYYISGNLPVIGHKCLVISREQYIQLAAENLFYLDNGVLWVGLKLSTNLIKILKDKDNEDCREKIKFNLNYLTSGLQRKFGEGSDIHNRVRVVPIVGSKHCGEDIVLCTENEYFNINSSFNTVQIDNIEVSFHPVPSIDFSPKIAAVAEVSLVQTDYDLANDFVKEVLGNFFVLPKLFHVDDVFSIVLTPEITIKQNYKYADLVYDVGKLYFKVNKLSYDSLTNEKGNVKVQQPFFIVKGVTQLSLGDSIHSLRPRDEYFPLDGSTSYTEMIQACPTGLKLMFDQIQETIAPFIHGEMNDLMSSLSAPIIPMLLLTGPLGSGRHLLVNCVAKYNGLNCLNIDCNALQSSTAKQTEAKISATVQKAKAAAPCIVMLDNFDVFAVDAENNEDCRVIEYFVNTLKDLYQNYTKHAIIFIAISDRADLKPNILRIFLEKFHIHKPNAQQRFEMLKWFAQTMQLKLASSNSEDKDARYTEVLERTAAKTETFQYGDLDTLIHFAVRESYLRQQENSTPNLDMHRLHEEDLNKALESMRSLQSQHLDAPKIPKVYWEDIGGLDKLKKELLKTIEFPIKYPHLFKKSSLKRSGILLYGPPGCGKTLVAKAVSTELNVSFLSVKGPELLNMYIGQSEENVRRVFESARACSPCIVFLDELDALAPARGSAGDSGGAGDRVVSQLLAAIDGVTTDADGDAPGLVFVMGATNRPDLLEQSLLRPGRLDKLVYVGPYNGAAEKTCVLKALCRKHTISDDVDLPAIAESLPLRCTGADLLQVTSAARAAAVRTLLNKLQIGLVKESELSVDSVVLTAEDFWHGVQSFRPSVTDDEMAYYESLQNQI